ncbi:MAG: hypothetical protein K0Q94_1622 [Paenibacillus sp.]|jgi:nitrous oxidase accessory protein NosD|nr:hypothetical protein [Paenibacillus sp.]
MKNVVICNNLLLSNQTGQINCQNDLVGVQSSVSVYGNTIRSGPTSPVYNYIYGIRLDGQGPGSSVHLNDIRGCYYGIRIHDGDEVVVSRNTVDVKVTGIFVDLQTATGMDGNRIEDNDVRTEDSHCIHIKNTATIRTLVRNNKMETTANVYRIADTATGTVLYGNEFGHASSLPAGRAVRGEIVRSSDPVATGCMGWIATNTDEHAVFAPFEVI